MYSIDSKSRSFKGARSISNQGWLIPGLRGVGMPSGFARSALGIDGANDACE